MKDFLIDPLKNLDSYEKILEDIERNVSPIGTYGIIDESLSQLIMGLNIHSNRQVILITEDEQKSKTIYEDIINLSTIDIEIFPRKETFNFSKSLNIRHVEL